MTERATLKRRFLARAALLAAVWLVCAVLARGIEADGAFGAVIHLLAVGLPFAAPVILWLDWRWLVKQEGQV